MKAYNTSVILYSTMALLIALLFTACEKKELCELPHPHQYRLILDTQFNSAWQDDALPYLNRVADYDVRYTYEFWTMDSDGNPDALCLRHQEVGEQLQEGDNSHQTVLTVPASDMRCMVWVDLVPHNGDVSNPCFDVSQLTAVKLLTHGFHPQKDAFSASCDLNIGHLPGHDVESTTISATLQAKRVLGAYKLIANDYDKFLAEKDANIGEPSQTRVDYQLWIPTEYNCFMQRPQQASANCSFMAYASLSDRSQCELATDLLFIGANDDEQKYYNAVVTIWDSGNTLIAHSENFSLQLHRNHIARIYGPFLTTSNISGSSINDDFDGFVDIVIQ